MKVYCGTRMPVHFDIDIDDYATAAPTDANSVLTDADPVIRDKAITLLQSTMFDDTFADDGCRNDDAVNACIALHVLGYDPKVWFENFFDANNQDSKFFETDIDKFMDHVERVCDYVDVWGPVGSESDALTFALC